MIALPASLAARPLSFDDVRAVGALWRACERHDDGIAEVTDADVVADWQRPSFDLATRSVGVVDGGTIVAAATLSLPDRADVFVSPSHRGRGIGAALMRWTWDAARAAGAEEVGQLISENDSAGAALLRSQGYAARRAAWVLEIALEREPDPAVLPAGYAIRAFEPVRDDHAAHEVIEGAFAEWREHGPEPFADWEAETLLRPGFTPSDLALAVRGEEVAGALVRVRDDPTDWVDQLAVARPHRGRGLARALLQHAFGDTWRRGGRECALVTDSRTGALGLYEHLGMALRRSYTYFAKPV